MANVAFSQSPKPSLVYVIARQVVSDESDPVTYEKISVTLDRAKEAGGWYGIALSKAFLNKADIEETIKWTEANKKIFGFTFVEQTLPVSTTNYFRSFAVYGGGVPDVEETPDENYYISLAMMAKCFGYDPGSETWGLKQLAAVYPCKLSTDMKNTVMEIMSHILQLMLKRTSQARWVARCLETNGLIQFDSEIG